MDPNACLALIFDHIENGDHEEAFYACMNLAGWIKRGGFNPTPWQTFMTPDGETGYNVDELRGFLRVTMDNCKRRSVA
jgi:hypothetical protein